MLNWLNRKLGTHAPMAGVITVFAFILGASLGYSFVRDFGVNNSETQLPEVKLKTQ